MSSIPVASVSSQNSIDQLIQKVMSAVDTNHDGQLSTTEFGAFLEKLLGASGQAGTASVLSPSITGDPAGAPTTPTATQILPSTWTDNNAPYGVTFAGFSPQDHTNLTLADLANPQNAKYAAYDYLVSNHLAATSNWAPAAADALNQQYGTTIFKATDGETLSYGDEYIHSAPNGYGMAPSTYNANATGEFFWGAE
jgi:hypothetical protein